MVKTLAPDNHSGTIELEALFRQWEGRSVLDLPYFEKLENLFRLLSAGWKLDLRLELQGKLALGVHFSPSQVDFVLKSTVFLDYLRRVRVLSDALKQSVVVHFSEPVSPEDNQQLVKVVDTLEGRMKYRAEDLHENPSFNLIADRNASNIKDLQATSEPRVFTIVYATLSSCGAVVPCFSVIPGLAAASARSWISVLTRGSPWDCSNIVASATSFTS